MSTHLLQSSQWAEFKQSYGTPAVLGGGVWYTKHAIPLTAYFYAYSARVDPRSIDFLVLRKSLEDTNCIAIHFDVPNVIRGSEEAISCENILKEKCVHSSRDEFAKGNFLVDLTRSEDDIFADMHPKQRYNIRYAQKGGVAIKPGFTDLDFDTFYELYKQTGVRQKYFYRSKKYLRKMFDVFVRDGMVSIMTAYMGNLPLASWMLVAYDGVLYYPYGGSSEEYKNLQASCLVGWEAMKYGKRLGLTTFDMWGASDDLQNTNDAYFGFTNFKAKYGGKHVVYIDSYDYIVNEPLYKFFTVANSLRWKLLNILR